MSNKLLLIEATEDTPRVEVDALTDSNVISIKGVSMPENTLEFYEPLKEELLNKLNFGNPTTLSIEFSYMNSMSNKQIIKLIALFQQKCKDLTVIWKYERNDDLMKLKGEEITMVLRDVKLNLTEIN